MVSIPRGCSQVNRVLSIADAILRECRVAKRAGLLDKAQGRGGGDLAAAHFGVRGQREFTQKYDDVAFVMAAMDSGQSLVTLSNSGIKTFADVKDLRVAANTESSRAALLAALKLYGVREKDVRLSLMNYTEQLAALRERTLDAGFIAVWPAFAAPPGPGSALGSDGSAALVAC